ncbi:allantoinase Ecym_5256 [Eremothecium cymbalariae DBVPG|uniref:allantoinase n=1 Tax=Eremothecium cymbalariae (strain CBS 270.75 / DBVPG 7215 / KCTC 17166 / NRRL Y-17582) TaxID=931890 RepID=I6ND80_ERECY|nr:hypothetical protein Ecym_5256 [Eremothecium cymbalariae DBVPG\
MISMIGSSRVVLDGQVKPATIVYSNKSGKILQVIHELVDDISDVRVKDYGVEVYHDVTPNIIMPGLVDSHVHLNEPGRTEWEGFTTGTKAAASGGVTTVVDMPLNSIPPTTTVKNFEAKLEAANGQCWCDVAFWGGLVPSNLSDLVPLTKFGVRGFKGFLMDSGVKEFPAIDATYINAAIEALKGKNSLLLFHAETDLCSSKQAEDLPTDYSTYLKTRPDRFETDAISVIISCLDETSKKFGDAVPKVHIVHLSSEKALSLISQAKDRGLPITAETCFHYLTIAAEDIPSKATTYKCAPPIRDEDNRKALWDGLRKNILTTVVSDHSPCTPQLKDLSKGNFLTAWGGISSVGFGLPLLFTYGAKLEEIVRWCAENTAKQVALDHQKGFIRMGYDADFLVFDDTATQKISNANVFFKNKLTAYDGLELTGRVVKTFLRGNLIYHYRDGHSKDALGQLILEPRT